MMQLARLAALAASVRDDGSSPVADEAGLLWTVPAGTARYVRTSAAFVLATPGGYLRLTPVRDRALGEARTNVRVAAALAAAGAPVTAPLPSTSGRLVEVFEPGLPDVGRMHASLIASAPGRYLELADLGEADLLGWGRSLARVHQAGRSVDASALAAWPDAVVGGVGSVAPDAELLDAVGLAGERCLALLGPPTTLVHGDPQPDNAAWGPGGPVFFDLDDMALSWPLADAAMAVRDAQPIDCLDRPATDSAVGQALLRGYREVADLDFGEERAVSSLQRLSAAATYGRLMLALRGPAHGGRGPAWLGALHDRLTGVAQSLRAALLIRPSP